MQVEGPAEDAAQVQPFQPLLLEEGLLLERVPNWMEQYESGGSTTAPTSLRRTKQAAVWFDVLTGPALCGGPE